MKIEIVFESSDLEWIYENIQSGNLSGSDEDYILMIDEGLFVKSDVVARELCDFLKEQNPEYLFEIKVLPIKLSDFLHTPDYEIKGWIPIGSAFTPRIQG